VVGDPANIWDPFTVVTQPVAIVRDFHDPPSPFRNFSTSPLFSNVAATSTKPLFENVVPYPAKTNVPAPLMIPRSCTDLLALSAGRLFAVEVPSFVTSK
jgi:hypothetical protein